MYRHLKVTSLEEMNKEIIKFLADLLNVSSNVSTIKILSKNGKNVMWFVKDPLSGGLSTWIGDVNDLSNPWETDATVGVAGKYKLDMWRKELDSGETATAKSKLHEQNQKGYNVMLKEAKSAVEKRNAYLIWYYNNKKIKEDVEVYKDVCHRVSTTNPFHVGGLLSYNEVTNSPGFKWLDCLYNDGTFMFSLYGNTLPWVTRSTIIGELDTYQPQLSGKTYILSNSWTLKSYQKNGRYNDSFFLEDIVGENRIPSQQAAIALGENKILDDYIEDYEDKKAEENEKKAIMDSAQDDYITKNDEYQSKDAEATEASRQAAIARQEAEQETDPEKKIEKEAEAARLEEEARILRETADELGEEASEAEQVYYDAKSDYEDAVSATKEVYDIFEDVYIDVFSRTVLAVGNKEDNINHHVADCPGSSQVVTYNNDIFCAYRLDVDYDSIGDAEYSVNGHKVAFHLHTAPKDLHLRYYDTSSRYYPPETMTSPVLYGWEHQLLHYTYESYFSNVGVTQYPLLDTNKKQYEKYDNIREIYKSFSGFSRSGNGGNSVNNMNNVSTVIPLIFYVERDSEELDTWSATGQTSIVNYVNMYNMGTGTMFHSQQHDAGNLFGCYNLWKRRMGLTFWNPKINDEDDEYTEAWGFGGYVGIAFKVNLKDDLTSLRDRVVV